MLVLDCVLLRIDLALISAALFALVSVLLRRLAPEELDLGSFMGMNGLLTLCASAN